MLELDDCGKAQLLVCSIWRDPEDITVMMVIRAPRGTLALFHNKPRFWPSSQKYSFPKQARQCRAIRAFMKEHQNE